MRDTEYAKDEDTEEVPGEIQFLNKGDTLTLWVEKRYDDGWFVGWCPELQNTMSVHPNNVILP